jgi:hypothetical protein
LLAAAGAAQCVRARAPSPPLRESLAAGATVGRRRDVRLNSSTVRRPPSPPARGRPRRWRGGTAHGGGQTKSNFAAAPGRERGPRGAAVAGLERAAGARGGMRRSWATCRAQPAVQARAATVPNFRPGRGCTCDRSSRAPRCAVRQKFTHRSRFSRNRRQGGRPPGPRLPPARDDPGGPGTGPHIDTSAAVYDAGRVGPPPWAARGPRGRRRAHVHALGHSFSRF